MKILIGLFILSLLPCIADPAYTQADETFERDKLITKLHAIVDSPQASEKDKADAAIIAMKVIDMDTEKIAVEERRYKSLMDLCNLGILPDGVKPSAQLYPTAAK